MTDRQLLERIDALVDEEMALHGAGGLDDAGQAHLRAIEVQLDEAWDLMRQRRARRAAGLDPDAASERDGITVEDYEQ